MPWCRIWRAICFNIRSIFFYSITLNFIRWGTNEDHSMGNEDLFDGDEDHSMGNEDHSMGNEAVRSALR